MLDITEIQQHITDATQDFIDEKGKIQASVIFCSYVKDNTKLDKEIIGKFFLAKKATRVLICKEHTAEGKVHHHALVIKDERFTIRNMNQFDINGEHPNIRYALKSAIPFLVDYVIKEDRSPFLYRLDPRDWSKKVSSSRGLTKMAVDSIIEESENADEAIDRLTENGLTMKEYKSTCEYVRQHFPVNNKYYYGKYKFGPEHFTYPDVPLFNNLKEIINGKRQDRYLVYFIVGLTRRQKTTALRALIGPHLYFKNKVDLCGFANVPSDVKAIIMDDIKPENRDEIFTNNALMLGMEDGWTQKFLYIGDQKVENPVPVIYLCNELPKQVSKEDNTTGYGIGYYYQNSMIYEVNQYMRNIPHRYIEQKLFTQIYKKKIEDFSKGIVGDGGELYPSLDEIKKAAEDIKDAVSPKVLNDCINEMYNNYVKEKIMKSDRVICENVVSSSDRDSSVEDFVKDIRKRYKVK